MRICSVKNCSKEAKALGLCTTHYRRKQRYGDPEYVKQKQIHGATVEERFLSYLGPMPEKPEECWEWQGSTDSNGYGRLNVKGIPTPTHRLSWKIFKGEIPEDKCVLHRCDNPLCVRPSHLFIGTQSDNADDMWSKNRGRPGHALGSKHGCAKLTERKVLAIRANDEKDGALAKKYKVSRTTINDIRKRKIWKHI